MNSSKIAVFSAIVWSGIGRITAGFLRFVSTPLLLNHYGKEQYGLIGLAISINVYMQIMELGFNTGNLRYLSQWLAEKKHDKVVKLIQSSMFFYGLIGLLNFVLLVIFTFYSGDIFNLSISENIIFTNMLYILAVSSLISWTYSITSQILRAYEKIALDERLNLIGSVLAFLAVILSVYFNLTISQYFLLYGVSIIVVLPIKVLKCKALNSSLNFKFKWNSEVFNEVFKYSIGIFGMAFFQFSARNLRPVILGMQASVGDVADYKIIEQITGIILLLSGSFMAILLPFVTKMKALNNIKAQLRVVYDGTRFISVFLAFLIFGLVIVAEPLIIFYVGTEYIHLSFWLIVWSVALLGYHISAISAVVLADSNIRPLAYYSMFSALISLTSAWLLTPNYQVGGAVISLVIYTILQMLFYYVYYIPYVMNLNPLKLLVQSFLKPVIIGIISLVITKSILLLVPLAVIIYQLIVPALIFTIIYCINTLIFIIRPSEIKVILKKII